MAQALNKAVTAVEVRRQFLEFFKSQSHLFIPSTSVLCGTGHGTYFTNAGMNQFRGIFEAEKLSSNHPMANVKKAVNSQRCIRMNDLVDVGRDGYHHTAFEMLGTWAFGLVDKADSPLNRLSGKKEAIYSAWELLTKVYGIDQSRLYITYFGGDASMSLEPDLETRDIWLLLGIPSDRIMPASAESNFWTMGEMGGPCGPCTEVHYATGSEPGDPWPSLLELWNIVFISYSRDASGNSRRLPRSHIDTGLGLERLAAVLGGKKSNYGSDIFSSLFKELEVMYKLPPYQDEYKSDGDINFVYRVLADHARMATISIADGVLPSNRDLGHKVRTVLTRGFSQLVAAKEDVLENLHKSFPQLARVVLEKSPLSSAFPELVPRLPSVISAFEHEAQRFASAWVAGKRAMNSVKNLPNFKLPNGSLNPEAACRLLDGSVPSMSIDLLASLSKSFGLSVDISAVKNLLVSKQSKTAASAALHSRVGTGSADVSKTIPANAMEQLRAKKIPPTCDLPQYVYHRSSESFTGYQFPACEATILSVLPTVGDGASGACCWVVLDKSNLHPSNLGGQATDFGYMEIAGKSVRCPVTMVQQIGAFNESYILHRVEVPPSDVPCGSRVKMFVEEGRRLAIMRAHTACHLTMAAVRALAKECDSSQSFLSGTMQAGSSVDPDRFTVDIQTPLQLTDADLISKAQSNLDSWVKYDSGHVVETDVVSVEETAKNQHIIRLPNEEYPPVVRVVKVGNDVSQELCCGTHVARTADIGAAVILSATGGRQGVKRFAVVTGPTANAALEEGRKAADLLNRLKSNLDNANLSKEELNSSLRDLAVIRRLTDSTSLPRVVRDKIASELEGLTKQAISKSSSFVTQVFANENKHEPDVRVVPLAWRSLRTDTTRQVVRSSVKQLQKENNLLVRFPVVFIDAPIEPSSERPLWVMCALPLAPGKKTIWAPVVQEFNLRADDKKDSKWLIVDGAVPLRAFKDLEISIQQIFSSLSSS